MRPIKLIELVKLIQSIKIIGLIKPIKLINPTIVFIGLTCLVAAFGAGLPAPLEVWKKFKFFTKGSRRRVLAMSVIVVISLSGLLMGGAPKAALAATYSSGTENGLVGWWRFDENTGTLAGDSTGRKNTGTLSGATKPTWVSGKHGGALSFDGSSGYVDAGKLGNFGSGRNNGFNVSFWVYPKNNTSIMTLFGLDDNSNNFQNGLRADINANSAAVVSAGSIRVAVCSNDATPKCILGGTNVNSAPINKWTHVSIIFIPTTNTINVYANGVLQPFSYSRQETPAIFANFAQKMFIGALNNAGSIIQYFNGLIDDMRIYNRALTADEVYKLYKSGETVINKIPVVRLNKGLVGYWPFDGNTVVNGAVQDKSGNGNTGYPTNIATSTFYTAGKIGQGFKFDGVSSMVSMGDVTFLDNLTSVSVSAWVYPTAFVAGKTIIAKYFPSGAATDRCLYLVFGNATGRLDFQVGNGANTGDTLAMSGAIPLNKWSYVTATWDGQTQTIYVNGAYNNSRQSLQTDRLNNNTLNLEIGRDNFNAGTWNGSLDDVRIYSRALNPAEVKALYKMGQATINKTPVNRLSQGLVGYWTFDGKDITNGRVNDVSGNGNHGFPTNISTSTFYTAGKIGQGGRFDGVNDQIQITDSDSLHPTNFTVSAWVKRSVIGIQQTIFSDTDVLSFKSGGISLAITPTNKLNLISAKNTGTAINVDYKSLNSLGTIGTGWTHVVGSWDGSNLNVYINGVFDNSVAWANAPAYTSPPAIRIGIYRQTGIDYYPMNGLIDDVRVYNRALSAGEVKQLYNMGR